MREAPRSTGNLKEAGGEGEGGGRHGRGRESWKEKTDGRDGREGGGREGLE